MEEARAQQQVCFLKYLNFLELILMEHIGMKNRSGYKLQVYSICSIKIGSRNQDIVEKPL